MPNQAIPAPRTPARKARLREAVAIAVPLGGAGLVFLVWWLSDRFLVIGPFDRATFGWLVVVPAAILVPVIVGYLWRAGDAPMAIGRAGLVGVVDAVFAAMGWWSATAFPDCQFGARRTPVGSMLPSAMAGVVVGGGFADACVGCTAALRQWPWWSAVLLSFGLAAFTSAIFLLVVAPGMTLGCQRPPV